MVDTLTCPALSMSTIVSFCLQRNGVSKALCKRVSGRVFDLRQRGCGFKPHRRHCVVSLSKTHLSLLSTGSTQDDPFRHNRKIVDWDVKNPIKQINCNGVCQSVHHCSLINAFIANFSENTLYKISVS